jgi:hypothetical protein
LNLSTHARGRPSAADFSDKKQTGFKFFESDADASFTFFFLFSAAALGFFDGGLRRTVPVQEKGSRVCK